MSQNMEIVDGRFPRQRYGNFSYSETGIKFATACKQYHDLYKLNTEIGKQKQAQGKQWDFSNRGNEEIREMDPCYKKDGKVILIKKQKPLKKRHNRNKNRQIAYDKYCPFENL